MRTIVVSAVNLVEAGTLAILRDCLSYLSTLAGQGEYRVVAVVYKKELADFPHIEYIETQWPKKRWLNRLWYEYVSMRKISKELAPVYLWLSLHDTSPSVIAERQAVYCHNSFSFYRWKMHDWIFAPKIAMFALLTRFIYQTNIHKNRYLVVQQEWFRQAMAKMFDFPANRILVAPPQRKAIGETTSHDELSPEVSFFYAASPNSHKNFECICRAVEMLNTKQLGKPFSVSITLKGNENKYAQWIGNKWGKTPNLQLVGFLNKVELLRYYSQSHCLIFPSKIETWGLPISEFATYSKPMLLSDLPYAHETAAGSSQVAFFNPDKPEELARLMEQLIVGNTSHLKALPSLQYQEPYAPNWEQMFNILLNK